MSPHTKLSAVSYIPTLKISPAYVVQYFTRVSEDETRRNNYTNFFNEEEQIKPYSGEMSAGSRKRLKEACELMIEITDEKSYYDRNKKRTIVFKLALLTTTLSAPQERITDREIKEHLLAPYLRKLKKYGLTNYIWKAERQRNGNLHFHIFIDCFIDHTDARNIWNRIQSKFHFIRNFQSKFGHSNPNSTDIKPIENGNKAVAYMLKYMVKSVDKNNQLEVGRPAEKSDTGKTWDCTTNLKERNDTADFATNEEFENLENNWHGGNLKKLEKDYATIYFYINPDKSKYLPESLMDRYRKFIAKVKDKPS
jgi:uncharacterized phage-like protein YoqJ